MAKIDTRYIIAGLSILIALLVANTMIEQARHRRSLHDLLSTQAQVREEIVVVRNQHQSLQQALESANEDQEEIKSLLASLKRPLDTQYIVRTETILVPQEPVTVFPELPDEYLHVLEPDIVTGRFSITENNQFQFDTYPLSFKTNLVISENQTAVLLQGSSGYDNVWHDLPVSVTTTDTRERKIFEPNLQVGGGLQYPLSPGFKLGVSVWHPRPNLDALVVSGWLNQPALTIEPISYNIGAPLPLVNNLWIAPGVGINSELQPVYTFGIAAKL